jgi:hypothetical protein
MGRQTGFLLIGFVIIWGHVAIADGARLKNLKNREGAIAILNLGAPVQPSHVAWQCAGFAAVAIAVLLITPPGVANLS